MSDHHVPLKIEGDKVTEVGVSRSYPDKESALLPCPFCGGAMEEVTDEDGHYFVHPGRQGMARADCWLADAWVSDEATGEGSMGEWNTRAPQSAPVAQTEGHYSEEQIATAVEKVISGMLERGEIIRGRAGWPASLPPKREVQKLIEDFIVPDLDTEKAFATHRRSWMVQCLQALLTTYALSSTHSRTAED